MRATDHVAAAASVARSVAAVPLATRFWAPSDGAERQGGGCVAGGCGLMPPPTVRAQKYLGRHIDVQVEKGVPAPHSTRPIRGRRGMDEYMMRPLVVRPTQVRVPCAEPHVWGVRGGERQVVQRSCAIVAPNMVSRKPSIPGEGRKPVMA